MLKQNNKIEELQLKLDKIRSNLALDQQRLFSLGSVQNYLNYYKSINHYQEEVLKLLSEYFQVMEYAEYSINKEESKQIGIDYIMKIGYFYNAEAGFKLRMELVFVFFWGPLADLLLLVLELLKRIHYIPVVTLLLFIQWTIVKLFYERKNKIYDIGY